MSPMHGQESQKSLKKPKKLTKVRKKMGVFEKTVSKNQEFDKV